MTEPIPGPRGLPIVGNLLDIRNEEGALKAMEHLINIYGPVIKISVAGRSFVAVASADLIKEFTNERLWEKTPPPALDSETGARGLFVARSDDPDWAQAHRILMPAFGQLAVEGMFENMKDIAYQMVLKWARQGDDHGIVLTDDFTRLTLDTIALCAMDYRFNSFYSESMHPFVDAMIEFLIYSGIRSNRPSLYNKYLAKDAEAKYEQNEATMNRIAKEVIDRRRAHPVDKNDLLNTMLYGKDPKTGEQMRDELIMANMVTFLIAGHETTSGLLSFAFMNLMQNPKAYLKAQQEVDDVVGTGVVTEDHLKNLKYLNAVLRETLRLTPTAPAISKRVARSRHGEYVTICDGKYHIKNDESVRVLLGKGMRDPSYFGADADEFRPERMLEDNPDFDRYMQVWKPFGNGSRSCIGQSFAWQEALLVSALILQNFDINLIDPAYKLVVKQSLTIKPRDLDVKARLRKGLTPQLLEHRLHQEQRNLARTEQEALQDGSLKAPPKTGLQILYGSNAGTCSSLAQRLASTVATKCGITASVSGLDSAVDKLSRNEPVVIITASYEGQPPDNAARFVAWLESSDSGDMKDVRYATFGVGHRDWKETFHRIPKLIDSMLEERGASRIIALSTTDVSQRTTLDDFDLWQAELIKLISDQTTKSFQNKRQSLAEISTDRRASQLSSGLSLGKIRDVQVLTEPGQPEKRHMEIELPAGFVYEAGDYLAVLPLNSDRLVSQILKHWGLPRDATITLKPSAFGSLPANIPLSIHELLKGYFELSQPVSKSTLEVAKQYTKDSKTIAQIEQLTSTVHTFQEVVTVKHLSLFNILERYQDIDMPMDIFMASLLPLRVRQYSISSSPVQDPTTCTITYSVVKHTAVDSQSSGADDIHEGVASTYLSTLSPGETIRMSVRRTATANLACAFRLPTSGLQSTTPLLMFCAGTGLAPFRGFVQQRAIMLKQNPSLQLAPALLFIGCRTSKGDRLYAEEMDLWQKLGAVDLRYAFSREPEHALAKGCRYIGDRIVKDMADVVDIWERGAKVYVCGSRRVQDNVTEAAAKIFDILEKQEQWNDRDERQKSFQAALAQRAVADIFDT